ncbi:MAG: helix-turn-helix transcriptional regulator [Candidatus Margulisiibacteriota bacterium]|nr:helix-turn-helix transcriptional regulator [Candidatus Margulisiibacteriota bacterium]
MCFLVEKYNIKSFIKLFIQQVNTIGYDDHNNYEENKRIILSNFTYCLWSLITSCYIFIFIFTGASLLGYLCVLMISSNMVSLYLNHKKFYLLSRLLFFFTYFSAMVSYSAAIGPKAGIQFTIFALLPTVLIFFDQNHKLIKTVLTLILIALYGTLEVTNYNFFYKLDLSTTQLSAIRHSIVICIFILVSFTQSFLISMKNYYKKGYENLLKIHNITDREAEIIELVQEGLPNKDISAKLYIEESTVKKHLGNIFKKLNIKNRTELALINKQLNNT